jgi:hypothetical protein
MEPVGFSIPENETVLPELEKSCALKCCCDLAIDLCLNADQHYFDEV